MVKDRRNYAKNQADTGLFYERPRNLDEWRKKEGQKHNLLKKSAFHPDRLMDVEHRAP